MKKSIIILISFMLITVASLEASAKPVKRGKRSKNVAVFSAPTQKQMVKNTKRHAHGIPVKIW